MNPASLQIVFAGTPAFAASALSALLASPYQVSAIYTQPDKPAGRGLQVTQSPVKQLAQAQQLPVFQPQSLKDAAELERMAALKADLMVVAAYGLLLPEAFLKLPRLGCINIHASLLPRWRGAAPIQHAILAGDQKTGITLMQMDAGLDTGAILQQAECPIYPEDTAESVHARLAELGAKTLISALPLLAQGQLPAVAQDPQQATYAPKINKSAGQIVWQTPALTLERQIRAFYPWPIAFTQWQGQTLRLFAAEVVTSTTQAPPGSIVACSRQGLEVATGDGNLRLLRVQLAGGRVLPIADFLNSRQDDFKPGMKFT